jgi:triphosphoribosyl-dephospho-CoA synthase CitG
MSDAAVRIAPMRGMFEDVATAIGELAFEALMDELNTTTKPGLVDRRNSGAHTDMDYDTFVRSAEALIPHFRRFARMGLESRCLPEPVLFRQMREVGQSAESDMYAATGGVNTHKGAIFSIGLLCGAAGRLIASGQHLSAICLSRMAAKMTAGLCDVELKAARGKLRHTAGERVFLKYGARGARGEAESGFESVRKYGLPRLSELLRRGDDKNTAQVRTLLSLMQGVTDTNVLARHDMNTALSLKSRAATLHRRYSEDGVRRMDDALIAAHISPGGCADLLAVTIFMTLLRNWELGL